MKAPTIEISAVRDSQWLVLRELRLAALLDRPEVFSGSFEQERSHDDAYWRGVVRRHAWFVAWSDGSPVGLAAGGSSWEGNPAERDITAMWTVPHERRSGVATGLLAAVRDWAGGAGANALTSWVIEGNAASIIFFKRNGFVESRIAPLMRDPSRFAHRFTLALA